MKIRVKSPARLHMGIIDLGGEPGRKYGSLGVAINDPPTEVTAARSSENTVKCHDDCEVTEEEIEEIIEEIVSYLKIDGGANVTVEHSAPKHVGLGSKTQLSLSVGTAIAKLYDKEASARELSEVLGRGKISSVGTTAFDSGGFTVNGGSQGGGPLQQTIFRVEFPEDWRFVVAIPAHEKGVSGEEEKKIFAKISAPPKHAEEISRIIATRMLPALEEQDIKKYGTSLSEVQVLVGKYFAEYQKGIYRDVKSESIVNFLLENGAFGAGQSSWGPTVYGLVDSKEAGSKLKSATERFMNDNDIAGIIYCTAANNTGATVNRE